MLDITKLKPEVNNLLRKGPMLANLTPVIGGGAVAKVTELASNLRIDDWCNTIEAKLLILGTIAVISVIAFKHRAVAGYLRDNPTHKPSTKPI